MHLHSHDAAAVWRPWRFRCLIYTCLIYMYGLRTMTPRKTIATVIYIYRGRFMTCYYLVHIVGNITRVVELSI